VIAVGVTWSGGDPRWSGLSEPDAAAVEIALTLSDRTGEPVIAVTVGPGAADTVVRAALAAGVGRGVRVPAAAGASSADIARALAGVVGDATWVVCGNASAHRGSGAVPALVAAELGIAQALGLIAVTIVPDTEHATEHDRDADVPTVQAVRRLDGGRREVLTITAPAVLSVEGAVARLRRPSITAELAARTQEIEFAVAPSGMAPELGGVVHPYRPRARVLHGPVGDTFDRVLTLLAAGTPVTTAETVTLDPPAAARRIVDALVSWGYLPGESLTEPCDP